VPGPSLQKSAARRSMRYVYEVPTKLRIGKEVSGRNDVVESHEGNLEAASQVSRRKGQASWCGLQLLLFRSGVEIPTGDPEVPIDTGAGEVELTQVGAELETRIVLFVFLMALQ
jgi:hypothetical protein